MPSPTAIQTFTGIFFDPFAPDESLVRIEDIAHALSQQCRFSGHLKRRWSVAQHSLFVSDLCPPHLKLAGLLHDAGEAYMVDLPRPIKHHPRLTFYRETESKIDEVVAKRFGLPFPIDPDVKRADAMMLAAEAKALLHGLSGWTPENQRYFEMDDRASDDAELVARIASCRPPSDEYVRADFLDVFRELGGK